MAYVGEVTAAFLAMCGDQKILGPVDYATVAEWEKQEIPLAIVLDSIREVCDKADDAAEIDSVGSFQNAVGKNFRTWLQRGET